MGGLKIATDKIRQPNKDNPYGYYELEKIKDLKNDKSCFGQAEGKAVKVISMLLKDLPQNKKYKLIFMQRKMDEILASQRKMLKHRKKEDKTTDLEMGRLYKKHLKDIRLYLGEKSNIEVMYVSYNKLLHDPKKNIKIINRFFDNGLNTDKMESAIDPSLYRNRDLK